MARKHDLPFEEFASDIIRGEDAEFVEVPIPPTVFMLVAAFAVLITLVMVGRIGLFSLVRGDFYSARAANNVNQVKPVPAHRGIITDRFGEVLAKNTETFSVYIRAGELLKDRSRLAGILSQLSEVLAVPVEELEEIIASADYERSSELALARNISSETAIAVRGLGFTGVSVENDFRREYPDGAMLASVLGYTGTSPTGAVVGKTGLELFYDERLRGTDGAYVYRRDARGATIDEHLQSAAIAGSTITTTIDAPLQRFFYKRLAEGLRFLGLHSGVGMAIDPRSGEVRALISFPSYDNNIFMIPGTSKQRTALFTDKNLPLFNRAVAGAYNPGSTIKPLVALAALHEGVIDPTTTIYSKGYIEVPNPYVPDKPTRFVEFNQKELGYVDVRSALARSSNVFFYSAGGGFGPIKGLGIDRLRHYWGRFGLGQKTGIDAQPEAAGFLPSPEEKQTRTHQPWRIGDSFNVSIGQGDLLVSPVQLINYIASIAHNGLMYQPHLVQSIAGQGVVSRLMNDYSDWKAELAQVQRGMRDGVEKEYGTSYTLHDLPVRVAAKTGSAQIENNRKTNAFFVGYAPIEAPELVVLVLIEDAKQGSLNAVPIAKDVFNWYYENRLGK